MDEAAAILVDWGTSNLRVWAVGPDGKVKSQANSDAGMRTLDRSAFPLKLDDILAQLSTGTEDVPIVMCGMVGSRQGWVEAPYQNVPASFDKLIGAAKRIDGLNGRDIRILPGLARINPDLPDVMRSEETQLLGLQAMGCFGSTSGDHLVCMPGSHAKWAIADDVKVKDFHTAITGELIAAIISGTVLRHAFGNLTKLPDIDAGDDTFIAAVDHGLRNPTGILNAIFATRPRTLLSDADVVQSAAWLSGSVIGHDVAAALHRWKKRPQMILLGGGKQGPLYQAALQRAGVRPSYVDADEASIAGLLKAACTLWPSRFEAPVSGAMELSIE
ncbi:MAG: 2-dehydro-3-deoxygalactonokinase [Pseudomonadota bacterium]